MVNAGLLVCVFVCEGCGSVGVHRCPFLGCFLFVLCDLLLSNKLSSAFIWQWRLIATKARCCPSLLFPDSPFSTIKCFPTTHTTTHDKTGRESRSLHTRILQEYDAPYHQGLKKQNGHEQPSRELTPREGKAAALSVSRHNGVLCCHRHCRGGAQFHHPRLSRWLPPLLRGAALPRMGKPPLLLAFPAFHHYNSHSGA